MQQSTTTTCKPQAAPGYPVVSYRLQLRHGARRDARRRGVSPALAIAAVESAYRDSQGNRFAARRAGWQAVDRLAWPGVGEG
ncbi:MAG: hypothetical protein ACREPV_01285 [Lysobacter sp.]